MSGGNIDFFIVRGYSCNIRQYYLDWSILFMKRIILDTDMGSDCDDCGALAVIHNLCKEGKCELLAVMCNIANKFSPIAIKSINNWYGKSDVPIAQTNGKLFENDENSMVFTKTLAEEYLSNNPTPVVENAVMLYRKILATYNDVTIISIGFMSNLAELLNSKPDDISPFDGVELVKKSVNKIYIMGGNFSGNEEQAEYNVRMDINSARTVAECLPVSAVYVGWEAGVNVRTGHTLWYENQDSPVKKSYELFARHYNSLKEDGTYDRPSWDPLTAYYAITDDSTFIEESEKCTVNFDKLGFTKISNNGKDSYIIVKDIKKAEETIEKYISTESL